MTDIPPFSAPDDPLERAAEALRRASVPEGPRDETIARTLAVLRAAQANTTPFYRRKLMRYALRIAAVVVVAAGIAAFYAGILPLRAPLAFAEVAAKLRDAHTITYDFAFQDPKQKEPIKMKVFFKDPGLMRSEGAGQAVTITDLIHGKGLLLYTPTKTAMLIDFKKEGKTKNAEVSMIEELRKLADKKGESAGKKRIGDVEAVGFRVEEEGFPLTVWADPKTKMPVLIEIAIRAGDQEIRGTMENFQLDPKLDDALFSLEPPEGYTLRKLEMKVDKPEEAVVHLLRAYAEKSGGKFPASLSMTSSEWQTYIKNRWGQTKTKGLPEPEFMQFIQQGTRVEVLLHSKKEHGYKPEGAKLGDRDRIVFWYRPDKADKYRAVYGDLHVADVNADQLPEKPKK